MNYSVWYKNVLAPLLKLNLLLLALLLSSTSSRANCAGSPSVAIIPDTVKVCFGSNYTYTPTNVSPTSGIVYIWESSSNATIWTAIQTSTAPDLVLAAQTITLNKWYRLRTICSNTNDTSLSLNSYFYAWPQLSFGTVNVSNQLCFASPLNPSGEINLAIATGVADSAFLTGGVTSTLAATNNSFIFQNLGNGAYTVQVSDANNCTISTTFSITSPTAININVSGVAQPTCNQSGAYCVFASGGVGPYSINTQVASFDTVCFSNLSAFTYTTTVVDAKACIATTTITLSQAAALTITATVKDNICLDGFVKAKLNISNGTPPYTYLWSNASTADSLKTNLVGTYTCVVTDAANCTISTVVSFTSTPLIGNYSVLNPTAGAPGSINITMLNGTAPFTYTWPAGTGCNGPSCGGLAGGTYTVLVTDATGCKLESIIELNSPLSIAQFKNKFKIYPNPSSEKLFIEAPFNLENLSLINALGQVVYSAENVQSKTFEINLDTIANGIYRLKIQGVVFPVEVLK
jgi:hypothetical protein